MKNQFLKSGTLFSPIEHFRKTTYLIVKFTSAFLILILFAFQVNAQEHQVTGTVTDTDGVSLPGVNVLVEGTTIGTITDADGRFTLTTPNPNSILIFSFVGYTRQRVPIEGREIVDLTLQEEFRAIDEIVVVGYGTRMKEELTGSVSSITGEQMNISTQSTALGRLQGQVSGVTVSSANTPGGEANIRVRGLGTINDNDPLYIIDGVPTSPDNNLNPNDIESISVLKDASSAAIYGTRGANGVIIITTKRGSEGQPINVNFTARTGVNQSTNRYDLLNTQEYGELLWLTARNQGNTPGVDWGHVQYGDGTEPRIPDYIVPAGAMEGDPGTNHDLYDYPDYLITKANKEGTDWYDVIYRNGIIQDYDLSLTGSGEDITYAFSGSYLNEQGALNNTGFERFTFRNNLDGRLSEWFTVGQTINVAYTHRYGNLTDNFRQSVISQAYRSQPIIPVYDIAGNYAGSVASGMGNSRNPLAELERFEDDRTWNYRILGNVYGEAEIIEGLAFRSLLGYNYVQGFSQNRRVPDPEMSEPRPIPTASRSNNFSLQWNWANTLNYSTTIADNHRMDVILGTEAVENVYTWLSASRAQYFSIDPNYMQISAGEADKDNGGSKTEWSLFSIFGRVNYDYMGKYLLEATIRRDGSSRFGPENRYGNFPAASFAWAVSQEDFMQGTRTWLDFLKLRLGWGVSGNDRIGNYNTFSTYGVNQYLSGYAIDGGRAARLGFYPITMGNPNVTWEITETVNAGVDGNFLNNSISFSFDLWERNTDDMLYRLSIPQVMGGAAAPFVNIGEMKNTGFDVELGYHGTAAAGEFRYNVTANISRYVNQIVKLADDVEEEIIFEELRGMYYTRATAGTAFPQFYGYISDGIFQDQAEADAHPSAFGEGGIYNQPGRYKYRDIDGNGYIDDNDRTYIGNPHPDFTGGLNIDLGYGNFDFNMFFYGSYGNDMINFVRRYIDFGLHQSNSSKDALYRSWGSPYLDNNEDAILPIHDQHDGSAQPSTAWIEDGSFLRLQNLRVSYTLPENLLNRMQINNIRIYTQISNLFTVTNYSGLDPDLNEPGGNMGVDQGAWPTPRRVILGVTFGL